MINLFSIATEKMSTTGNLYKMNGEQLLTANEIIKYIQTNEFIILENKLDTSIFRTKNIITISWRTQNWAGGSYD